MTALKEAQKALLRLNKRLATLEGAVSQQEATKHLDTFKVPVFFTTQFVIPFFDLAGPNLGNPLKIQESTIVNGAETCYVTDISHTYIQVESPSDIPFNPDWEVRHVQPSFNFRWNYRIASTQARYLSPSNGVLFSSRRSLGYVDVANNLKLARPLKFVAGDALTVEVEPILANVSTQSSSDIILYFTFSGFRTGEMA